MSFDPLDRFEGNSLSCCCQARVMLGDIYSQCREHCDSEQDETKEREFTPEQQPIIERMEREAEDPK